MPVSSDSSIVEPDKSGSNTATANSFDRQPAPVGQSFVDGAEHGPVTKYRRGSYYLALVLEIIETLESNRLSNTRNAILYRLLYVLASGIEKYWNEGPGDHGMGGTTTPWATLIHLADRKVECRPFSLLSQLLQTDS